MHCWWKFKLWLVSLAFHLWHFRIVTVDVIFWRFLHDWTNEGVCMYFVDFFLVGVYCRYYYYLPKVKSDAVQNIWSSLVKVISDYIARYGVSSIYIISVYDNLYSYLAWNWELYKPNDRFKSKKETTFYINSSLSWNQG